MTDTTETHADRKRREAASLLGEIIEAGGTVNLRYDRESRARLAIRFDLVEGPAATRLFIAYRTAQQANPNALRGAALDLVRGELERI